MHNATIKTSPPGTRRRPGAVLDAIQALVGIAARSLAGIGEDVSVPQFRVLVLLHRGESLTMSALAENLAVNRSTATRVCDRLQDKRLLRRRPDEQDRRALRVQLTAGGHRLVEQVIRRRNSHVDQIVDRPRAPSPTSATSNTSTTTAVDRTLFDGVLDPDGGALRPDLSRPGLGLAVNQGRAHTYRLT